MRQDMVNLVLEECCRKVIQNPLAVVQNVFPTLGIPSEQSRILQQEMVK